MDDPTFTESLKQNFPSISHQKEENNSNSIDKLIQNSVNNNNGGINSFNINNNFVLSNLFNNLEHPSNYKMVSRIK